MNICGQIILMFVPGRLQSIRSPILLFVGYAAPLAVIYKLILFCFILLSQEDPQICFIYRAMGSIWLVSAQPMRKLKGWFQTESWHASITPFRNRLSCTTPKTNSIFRSKWRGENKSSSEIVPIIRLTFNFRFYRKAGRQHKDETNPLS